MGLVQKHGKMAVSSGRLRGFGGLAVTGAIVVFAAFAAFPASAQLFRRAPVAIENARIITGAGEIIESGAVLIQGERIAAVGADIPVPENARRIDASGMTVTPGLIDIAGAIGSTAFAGGGPTHRAIDAFDHYAIEEITEALRRGVTTIYIGARGARGVTGMGTVIRLSPNPTGSFGEAIVEEATLCINLGSGDAAIARLATFNEVRKNFKDALAYREALETYEEELEEYEKKLAERAKSDAEKENEKKEEAEEAKEKGDEEIEEGGEDGKGGMMQQPPRPRPDRQRRQQQQQEGGEQADEKKDELKKPAEPRRNPDAEIILRAIDHELPIRVAAMSTGDILNAIELAEEFNLRLIIEDARELDRLAELVAEQEREPRVVITYTSTASPARGQAERQLDAIVHAIHDTDVIWGFGSGADSGTSGRFLFRAAQIAAQSSNGSLDPVHLLTAQAAELLGLDESLGRIEPGYAADLVLWSGDPLDPATRIERVYAAGQLAYSVEDQTEEGQ